MKTKFAPSVLIRDEYGYERTFYPQGWMYVLAFALRGVPWAVEEVESGRLDAAVKQAKAELEYGAFI